MNKFVLSRGKTISLAGAPINNADFLAIILSNRLILRRETEFAPSHRMFARNYIYYITFMVHSYMVWQMCDFTRIDENREKSLRSFETAHLDPPPFLDLKRV